MHFLNADLGNFININPNPSLTANNNDLIEPDFLKMGGGCQGYNLTDAVCVRYPVTPPPTVLALTSAAQSGWVGGAAENL